MNGTGQRIKLLRVEKGMSRKELAELLGVSPSTIGMYEQGRRNPDGNKIVKLCEVFSVSSDSLLGVSELPKDATDIIREMSDRIRSDKGITLNGAPLSIDDRERLLDAIEFAVKYIKHS